MEVNVNHDVSSPIPFNDLTWQWQHIEKTFMPAFYDLVHDGHFCLGPAVDQFENEFANYVGAKHAIGVNSGTSALHLALIVAGIQPGDKVLIPAQTFIATAWPLLYLQAIPILCDVEKSTGNIDINDAAKRLEPGTKAIIPVHLYGQPADMKNVMAFAAQHGLTIIEDACQAHGAVYENKKVGTMGLLGCYSFYPGKNLGALGEAGMIVTENDALAERLRSLRHHGQRERYIHDELGFNYRMEGIQGLVLAHKLSYLNEWTRLRRKIAEMYLNGLSDLPLGLPKIIHQDHVYHLFVIRTPHRDQLREWLNQHHIAVGLHYPRPLHRQPCLSHLNLDRDSFKEADDYANQGLSLPIFAGMTKEQTERVINTIRQFFAKSTL